MKTTRLFSAFVFLVFAARLSAEAPPENFVRSTETPEKLSAVQTRTVEYRPTNGAGPSILLVGASHLGTPEYYAALQKRLDACSIVLFEGVGLGEALEQGPGAIDRDLGIHAFGRVTWPCRYLGFLDGRRWSHALPRSTPRKRRSKCRA
jgi:hypothetical protein